MDAAPSFKCQKACKGQTSRAAPTQEGEQSFFMLLPSPHRLREPTQCDQFRPIPSDSGIAMWLPSDFTKNWSSYWNLHPRHVPGKVLPMVCQKREFALGLERNSHVLKNWGSFMSSFHPLFLFSSSGQLTCHNLEEGLFCPWRVCFFRGGGTKINWKRQRTIGV